MNAEILISRFARMGSRLQTRSLPEQGRRRPEQPLILDIRSDSHGEYFELGLRADTAVDVVDLRRRDRHLLLRARANQRLHYYLCGHDEQHWFVAAIPERAGALPNVFAAMEALKPEEVLAAQRRQGIKGKDRYRRKNAAYVRQGEWFFLPMPKLHVNKDEVIHNEPLSRGEGSKPHWAEYLVRKGGEPVYVCPQYPLGLPVAAYVDLIRRDPSAKAWRWRYMVRNADVVYVRGRIRHDDHKTILLQVWHKVLMNTEGESEAMRHLAFLD
jgi:hypothetical protein